MKNYFFLIFFLFSVGGFSQKLKPDFKSIEKNLKSSKSPYNYDKLIFKYKGFPKSLDSIEAQHLYYGRNFVKNKVSTSGDEFKNLAEALLVLMFFFIYRSKCNTVHTYEIFLYISKKCGCMCMSKLKRENGLSLA